MNLINQINAIKQAEGISQSDIAKQIGITSGAFSAYLNNKYSGNVENIENHHQKTKRYARFSDH